jgi:signal transduction histidine kinase
VHRISAALRSAATEPSGGQLPSSGLGALGELVQSFNSFSANLDTIVDARAQLAIRDAQLAGQARELEQLRDLERMRREFMANTSHELRTPLTIVLGYLESLAGNYGRMTDVQRLAGVRKATTGAQRLARLVEDILLVLRLEDGNFPLTRETFDLAELVRDAAAGIPLAYPGQPITIETGSTPILVESDPNRVRQILINLLDNAAKYSTEGAPILVRCTKWEGSIRAEVVDCSPGIPPEQRERLFQRFGKTGSVGRSGRVGTGLGLAISKSLAEALGGRIEVESTLGIGSTFRLVLPGTEQAESPHAEYGCPADWYGRSMAG